MRLLIVEDEADLAEPLAKGLRWEGYAVDVALDGDRGLEMLEVETYDLLILDLSLPGMDGLEIARRIRAQQPRLLILMLTARAAARDRVEGLNLGADDYLVKPFYFEELAARVRALLRRDLRARLPVLRVGDLALDTAARKASIGQRRLDLSPKELAILQYLMSRPGEVVSQEELLDHVWDAQVNPFTNVLTVHMTSLRRALGDSAREPRFIETVVGQGYRLIARPDDAETTGAGDD